MNEAVRIVFLISEEEWARTSAMRWKADVFPTYYCFLGRVSFQIGDQEVLGSDQFDMSLADLAVGLANVVGELRTCGIGITKFQQGDDILNISFQAYRDSVTVSNNLLPERAWTWDRASLEGAMVEFISAFTDEAFRRVPDLFGWRDLEILQSFSNAKTRD